MTGVGQLEDYLRGEFLTQRQEIEQIGRLVGEVVQIFSTFLQEAGGRCQWPYEVVRGEEVRYPTGYYSFSTSAMILLALAAALGETSLSAVARSTGDPRQTPILSGGAADSARLTLERGLRDFMIQSTSLNQNSNDPRNDASFRVTSSRSYGPNDPFTLLWILQVLSALGSNTAFADFQLQCERAAAALVNRVFQNRENELGRVLDTNGALEHVFPLLYVVQLRSVLPRNGGQQDVIDDSEVVRYLKNRLLLQLSYRSFAAGAGAYDLAELAFTMEAMLRCDPFALDSYLLDSCLAAIDAGQEGMQGWRPTRPFIANEDGMVLLPLSVEAARSLLRSSEIIHARGDVPSCMPRLMNFSRHFTAWVLTRLVRGTTGHKPFVGWHSEHIEDPRRVYVHMWHTSLTALYLLHYHMMLMRYRADTALALSNFMYHQSGIDSERTPMGVWEIACSTEPLLGGPSSYYCIYPHITRNYILPRLQPSAVNADTIRYSMLLYGPPGTGKTTLAEDIAAALGQVLITITPSDFTVTGEAGVESRAKDIFDVLLAQSNVVVLFDEIDRLILDRDSQLYLRQGDLFQFLTPGMLTKFRNVRMARRCMFIICTNFEERIDPAIKRTGRLDDQFLVLPPDKAQRQRIIEEELERKTGDTEIEGRRLDDADWAQVLSETALMVPGELRSVVHNVQVNSPEPLTRQLLAAVQQFRPAIRLSGYRPRFHWGRVEGSQLPTVQEPYTEFLFLLYIVSESGREFHDDELEVAKSCARALRSEKHSGRERNIEREVKRYIVDDDIAAEVSQVLERSLRA